MTSRLAIDSWIEGLRRIPDLRFELVGIYLGIDTVVIHDRNQKGGLVNDVLTFREGLVIEGHGTYLESVPYHAPAHRSGRPLGSGWGRSLQASITADDPVAELLRQRR